MFCYGYSLHTGWFGNIGIIIRRYKSERREKSGKKPVTNDTRNYVLNNHECFKMDNN